MKKLLWTIVEMSMIGSVVFGVAYFAEGLAGTMPFADGVIGTAVCAIIWFSAMKIRQSLRRR